PRPHLPGQALSYLWPAATGIQGGTQLGIERLHWHLCESVVTSEPFEQVVGAALAHPFRGGEAVGADHFVQRLPVSSRLDAEHEQTLGAHEWHLFVEVLPDRLGPYLDPRGDVGCENQNRVGREERLWKREATVGAVVQGGLQQVGR